MEKDYIHIHTQGGEVVAAKFTDIAKLHKKLAQVAESIGQVTKDGKNEHFRYRYTSYEAFAAQLRHRVAEAGLAFTLSSKYAETTPGTEKAGDKRIVQLEAAFTDTETGAYRTILFAGEGQDAQDKGMSKAITNGVKYGLMRCLLCSSEDDPAEPDACGAPAKPAHKPRSSKKYSEPTPPPGPAPKDDPQAHEDAFGAERVSPEQVSQIQNLYTALKLTPDKFTARLKKDFGKADTDELTQTEATRLIAYMHGKVKK